MQLPTRPTANYLFVRIWRRQIALYLGHGVTLQFSLVLLGGLDLLAVPAVAVEGVGRLPRQIFDKVIHLTSALTTTTTKSLQSITH